MNRGHPSALAGRRVLVAEDEYLVAIDLAESLSEMGIEVFGPAGAVSEALDLIATFGDRLDAAILDINLRDEFVYPVADELVARNIPFIFTTGYDALAIPPRHAAVPRCEKPINRDTVVRLLGDEFNQRRRQTATDIR